MPIHYERITAAKTIKVTPHSLLTRITTACVHSIALHKRCLSHSTRFLYSFLGVLALSCATIHTRIVHMCQYWCAVYCTYAFDTMLLQPQRLLVEAGSVLLSMRTSSITALLCMHKKQYSDTVLSIMVYNIIMMCESGS
jgi:hypothetical protein